MFTPDLILRVEFMCGITIKDAAFQAIEFAKKMECNIVFNFNGVELHAYSTKKVDNIVDQYYNALKRKHNEA